MAQANGKVVQIIGAVVDAEFPRDKLPKVYDALKVESADLGAGWPEDHRPHHERAR